MKGKSVSSFIAHLPDMALGRGQLSIFLKNDIYQLGNNMENGRLVLVACMLAFFIGFEAQAQIGTGLVAYYKLNGNGNDASGNGLNGTNNGATAAPDRFGTAGGAMYFNGTWIAVPNNAKLNFSTSFSMSFWYKKEGNNTSHIIGKGRDIDNCYNFSLNATSEGFGMNNYPPFDGASINPTSIQVWHHAVCVYNKTALKIQFYIDNVLVIDKTTSLNFTATNAYPFVMGRHFTASDGSGGFEYYFKGWLDEVRLYNRALTAKDVLELNSLVAYYKCDGNSTDSSGLANHGTNFGAISTQDRFGNCGKAMRFNGTSNYISAPNSNSLNSTTNSITMAGWAKATSINDGLYSLFCKVVPTTLNGQFRFYVEQNNTKRFIFGKNLSGGTEVSATMGSSFDISNWNHYAVSWNGTTARFYWNGVLVGAAVSYSGAITSIASAPLEIGRDAHGPVDWLKGDLDDLHIYNRALSATEIAQLYNTAPDYPAPAATLTCGLMASYEFDGNVTDGSPNGNNGTASNIEYVRDRKGNCNRAARFNGTNARVTVPNSASMQSPDRFFSYSAWIKIKDWYLSSGTKYAVIMAKTNTSNNGLFAAYINGTSNQLATRFGNGSVNHMYTFQLEKWYHITVTMDNGNARLYVNGSFISQSNYTKTANNDATLPMEIGREIPGNTEYFNGTLDDFRLFNRALTAPEVTMLYTYYNTSGAITPPTASISSQNNQTNICSGQSLLLSANPTSGVTYQWFKDGSVISGSIASTYTANATGSYQVRTTKNSGVGCDSLSLPFILNVNSLPISVIQGAANQNGCGSLNLTATTAGMQYQWRRNNSNISGATTQTYSANQSGSYTVIVTNGTTSCSCHQYCH
jgi:hypothetical protein